MKRCSLVFLLFCFGSIGSGALLADLTLPHFFSDHMVLQRDRPAAIWGTASPDCEITVSFKGKSSRVKADANGNWRTEIETGPADAKGSALVLKSADDSVTIDDVLVGEVWLASGQSNMVFTMNRVPDYEQVIAKANCPQIRMFNAPTVTAVEPQDDIAGEWTLCNAETTGGYSAVAFFFAQKLHTDLGIPIGVIKTAWGGKPVETFTSRSALETLSGTKALVDATLKLDADYDDAKAKIAYRARLDQWEAAARDRRKQTQPKGRLARKPTAPKRPLDTEGKPGVLFNSMIHPFIGYTIQGAIWYQGEANAKPGAVPYDLTLPLMIRDWRTRWKDDFSFYFVQLANFRDPTTEPGQADAWALLQDRMRRILETTPKTGMAIINDVGEAKDIHPKNKKDPGERLARWALAKDYGQDIIYSGPLYRDSKVEGSRIRISFDQSGSGLKARDGGPLKRFEVAGSDRVWHWGEVKIDGPDSILVSSPDVAAPVAVRYAWASNPQGANLVNSDGLPTSVFRTDDWHDVEPKVDLAAEKKMTQRRALAAQIKAINAQRRNFDRSSDEFKELTKKQQSLWSKLRKLAPVESGKK